MNVDDTLRDRLIELANDHGWSNLLGRVERLLDFDAAGYMVTGNARIAFLYSEAASLVSQAALKVTLPDTQREGGAN